ncbi:Stm1p [Sporobolomyces koalae]|uniref:Stm1p n=1 Tax=Sporobolomyces koalae TaxID=500713 RepID=UPI00317851F1
MSVFASNPFAALGDDGDVAPAPKPAPKAAAPAAAPKAAAPAKQERAPRNNNNNKRSQAPREINADVPTPGEDAKEDRAKNFARNNGSRGRGPRPAGGNPRGNAGTYQGGNRPRRENGGGRPFDRQSQTGRVDSEKAEAQGWGADEGKKELEAETLAEGDAKAEQETATGTATPVREAPIEEEDNTQTYEQYLAAQAEKKLNIAALPEARKANEGVEDDKWANSTAITKKGEAEEEWLMGAPKVVANKQKAKKEKVFLEIEAPIRKPTESARGGRGGARGGARGRGEARGRGGARGGAARGPRQAAPAVPDASAFPALA